MKRKLLIVVGVLLLLGGTITYFTTKDSNKTFIKETTESNKNVIAAYVIQEDGTYKEVESIPQEGYQLNTIKSTCSNGTIPGWDVKTKRFYADNLTKGGTSCYLYFDKYVPTASETILANITIKTDTPDFSQVATTDEGVYAVSDGMYGGTSYYWRGATTTNYVKFAGFCWRIVRINGDGTLRLIYDGSTCHANGTSTSESIAKISQGYNSSYDRSEYVGWTYSIGSQRTTSGTASNAKSQTDSWYSSNIIETNATKVADGKFCNDRNEESGYSWSSQPSSTFYYATKGRLESSKAPTLNCSNGDVYTLKVGLITADEVSYAGGVYGTGNSTYYLYNGQYYWTMSPYSTNWTGSRRYANMLFVNPYGNLDWRSVYDNYGLRPVINLRSDITFNGGNGTLDNPYVVS